MTKVSRPADLSRELRKALGNKTQAELAAILLVSRNYISQIEANLKQPSERLEAQMRRLLTEAAEAHKVSISEEPLQADYVKKRSHDPSPGSAGFLTEPVMLDPRFQPRAEPTADMCFDYFREYLQRAAQEPGGIGYVWFKLQREFPPTDFHPKSSP